MGQGGIVLSGKSPIFYNALLLTGVNLLLRLVSTSFQVYISGQIGAAGVGLLQLVLSVGGMAMTAASAGIRTTAMYLCDLQYDLQRMCWSSTVPVCTHDRVELDRQHPNCGCHTAIGLYAACKLSLRRDDRLFYRRRTYKGLICDGNRGAAMLYGGNYAGPDPLGRQ